MKHVILGNGPAGIVAAETIRKTDPDAEITVIGDEHEPPYSRMAIPYLLQKDIEEDGTYLRKDAAHFERLAIKLLSAHAESVDTGAHQIKLEDGAGLSYDRLLIATGASATKPPVPGIDLPCVETCWTLEDARRIAKRLKSGINVVQIGAGFIGCIILQALWNRGAQLTVVEMGDRMVPRMMTPVAGNMIKHWCQKEGVRVYTKRSVQSIQADNQREGSVTVILDNGGELQADLVISAAGVKPNIAFLAGSGIETDVGVVVDDRLQTNVPGVYAAGDVAQGRDFSTGEWAVHALQPTATEHGRVAALNMAGKNVPYRGSLGMNVLDTVGLLSHTFGLWKGREGEDVVESVDADHFLYIRLCFEADILIGAITIGNTQYVGAIRGLIQTRRHLGEWKEKLLKNPQLIMKAFVDISKTR